MSDREREEEKEPKFRIVDRRGEETESPAPEPDAKPVSPVDAEGQPKGNADAEVGKTEMTEEEREELQKEIEKSLKFKNTLIFILRTLSDQTWIHLGLVPNPITHLTIKNMDEARKLIDFYGVVVGNTKDEFDENTLAEINRLHSDLKVNYTNQLGAGL